MSQPKNGKNKKLQSKHQQKISTSLSSHSTDNQKQYFNRSSINAKSLSSTSQTGGGLSSSKKNSKKLGGFRKWFSKLGGNGKTDEEKAHLEISDKLAAYTKQSSTTMSMLLLGAGGSGKSTVLKQMEKIHNGDMMDDEKQLNNTLNEVHKNITLDMYDLCKHYFLLKTTNPNISFDSSDIENIAIKISTQHDPIHNNKLTISLANDIKILWNTDTMKNVFEIRKKSHIMDNTPWFMDRVETYANPNYVPTFDDYIRIRDCTTGVIHSSFTVDHGNKKWLFKIIDVGGQRAERRKWLKVFSGIDVVLYVMSLSSYDQVLYEDHNTRCWDETLNLFTKTASNKIFNNTDFIIFLNKNDIFQKKIKTIPFTVYNSDFPVNDAQNVEKIQNWIRNEFKKRFYDNNDNNNGFTIKYNDNDDDKKDNNNNNNNLKLNRKLSAQNKRDLRNKSKRGLHFHVTCATDTNQIETVVRYVQIELIRKLMSRAALL